MALPPLDHTLRIVDDMGRPAPEFLQWWQQQRGENARITDLNTAAQVSAVIDKLGSTRGSILYRGADAWVLLTPGDDGYVLTTRGAGADPEWAEVAATFLQLSDTPTDYSGQSGKAVVVSGAEDGLEFGDAASTFLALTDAPDDYSGQSGKVLAVKSAEDGLEFVEQSGGGDSGGGLNSESEYLTLLVAPDWAAPPGEIANGPYPISGNTIATFIATDVVFPTTFSEGGLFEAGGSVEGSWIGWRTVSSTNYLFFRAGDGGGDPQQSDTDTAVLRITDFPQDGEAHEVVWSFEYDGGALRIKLWIDGDLKGDSATTGTGTQDLIGSDEGWFGTYVATSSVPGGAVEASWPGSVGKLYYYPNYLPAAPSGGTTAITFLQLSDTPSDYSGQSGKAVVVKSAEDGLEFVDAASTFLQLTDAPTDYSGQSGKVLAAKSAEDGLEFVEQSGGGGTTVVEKTAAFSITNTHLSGRYVIEANFSSPGGITVPSGLTGTEPVEFVWTGSGQPAIGPADGVEILAPLDETILRRVGSWARLTPRGDDKYFLRGDFDPAEFRLLEGDAAGYRLTEGDVAEFRILEGT